MRYVAVNTYACEVLGYEREELLALRVTDVARYPEAPIEYAEMMAEHGRVGTAQLTRKDGSRMSIEYRVCETTVAGMPLYVCVAWPL
jgi:PAS domain S-box-containing protein